MSYISIIDCATETLTNNCYNRLVDYFKIPMKFHCPSMFGMDSLDQDTSKAYIILGSYSNIEDRIKWQKELAIFIDTKLKLGTPALGICFGHQLMADFYGAVVSKNKDNKSYQGIRRVKFNNFEATYFVAHSFQVEKLPKSLERIATSKECINEVIRHKSLPFTGIQGHPEASQYFIRTTLKDVEITMQENILASKDGMKFIENFLREYSLL